MDQVIADLAAQHAELRTILTDLTVDQWAAPSRCPGWSVADVVLHLAQSDEVAIASARGVEPLDGADTGWDLSPMREGTATIDEVVAAAVDAQRGAAPADLLARWARAADDLVAALAAADPKRPLRWVVGELPARTLATTRLTECWVHTGDVAEAVGRTLPFSDRLWHIARLAWRTIPYAFARAGQAPAGPVAVILRTPDGRTWEFGDAGAPTTVTGDAVTFCQVATRRVPGHSSGLQAVGPDADAVLDLVRTFA